MKLIIDRKKWLRGKDEGYMRRKTDGRMCCLGFAAKACGLPDRVLTNKGMPDESCREALPEGMRKLVKEDKFGRHNTKIAYDAAKANDYYAISEEAREEKIKKLLKKAGFDVVFIN